MSLLLKSAILRKLTPQSRTILRSQGLLTKKCPPKPEEETKCGEKVAKCGAASDRSGGEIPIGYQLLKNTQAKFQIKDDLPVWLKGGPSDRMMYLSTLGLATIGLGWSMVYIMTLILK